ncbi:MAG: RNA polymerase sigma factor FliA [Gammaproteobacteria bacterium]|nr:RNA polymerase sigma factor FliA [Gammaproteobacteria bacterium]MDH3450119.1 RNA polymerase sigma factor FliA [Gammaproteobacteria bacterium]
MYAEVENLGENDQIVRHASLVKRIAYHLLNRLPPTVQIDDLIQAGMVGLLEAASNFDPEMGASFETFAGIRIRGSMIDEIRRSDWTPRSVHRKFRSVSEAIRRIENETGEDARDVDVAAALGISISEYHQILIDSSSSRIYSIDTLEENAQDSSMPSAAGRTPEEALSDDEYQRQLAESIRQLPDKEQLVMSLYYDDELNFREIGEILEVTESRICQLHGQALLRIKSRMSEWNAGG